MDLAKRIETMRELWGAAPERVRGRAMDLADQVYNIRFEGEDSHLLMARVRSATDPSKAYDVRINLRDRGRNCQCPAHANYQDVPCKHTTAVVLATLRVLKGAMAVTHTPSWAAA